MESRPKRPLAVFCLSFVFAGFSGIHLSRTVCWVSVLLCGLAFLLPLLPPLRRLTDSVRRTGQLLLGGLFCGMLLLSLYTAGSLDRPAEKLESQTVPITGTVLEREYSTAYSAAYILRITEGEWRGTVLLLECPDTTLSPGVLLSCTADCSAFAENSGGFAQKRYYYSRDIALYAETETVQLLGTVRTGLRQWLAALRSALSARLQVALGRRDAALPAALLLGDRSQLSESLERDMRRLGISHMLAISGLHLTVLLGAAEALLRNLLPSKKPRLFLLAGLCVFYMALSGFSESVLRAGLMLLFSYAAAFLRRDSDFYTTLGVSASLICLFQPSSFYSIGLQLSVVSVAVLGCAVRLESIVFHRLSPRMRTVLFAVLLPVLVQTGLLPLLCLYFGEASLITPLANILFSPLISLLLYLTPLQVLLPSGTPLAPVLRFLVQGTEGLAEWIGQTRGITVSLTYPLCPLFAVLLSAALLCTGFLQHRRQMTAALCTAGILMLGFGGYLGICTAVFSAQNTVLSVQSGSNDGLILLSQGKVLLCDISDGSYNAMRTFYDQARKQHSTEVEVLMLTHLHKRHIHSFSRLSDAACVRSLLLPSARTEAEQSIADSLCEAAEERNIPVFFYEAEAHPTVHFGETEILPGSRTYLSRSTHPVITLRIQYGTQSIQYLGTSWNETNECPSPTDTEIVILGSHGPIGKTSFTLPNSAGLQMVLIRKTDPSPARTLPAVPLRESEEPVLFRFADDSENPE